MIQANHEAIVHHLVVYECPNEVAPYINTAPFDCDFAPDSIPDPVQRCRGNTVVGAWAVGGQVSCRNVN